MGCILVLAHILLQVVLSNGDFEVLVEAQLLTNEIIRKALVETIQIIWSQKLEVESAIVGRTVVSLAFMRRSRRIDGLIYTLWTPVRRDGLSFHGTKHDD